MFGRKRKEQQSLELYRQFNEFCEKIETAAAAFLDILTDYENVEDKISAMKVLETECDMKVHKIINALHDASVAPFDREDLYSLAKEMDNIVDSLEEAANRFLVFDIREIKPQAANMTQLTLEAARELKKLFEHLSNIHRREEISAHVIEVNRIENEGDIVYRKALSILFRQEKDPVELIKWKHLFEQMENSLDSCETTANLFEGIVAKYS